MSSANRSPVAAPKLLQVLWKKEPEFADGGMHDAHDFWLLAVDSLRQHPGEMAHVSGKGDDERAEGGTSVVEGLLNGEVSTTLRCETCGWTSGNVEAAMDLSIPLQPSTSVQEIKDVSDHDSTNSSPLHNGDAQSQTQRHKPCDGSVERDQELSVRINGKQKRHVLRRCGVCATCSTPQRKKACLRNKRLRSMSVSSFAECLDLGMSPDAIESYLQSESNKRRTLEECLMQSHRTEIVHKWMCDQCGCLRSAVKETAMRTLPKLLAIHLKRFDYNSYTRRSKKLEVHVECPQVLDIAALCTSSVMPKKQDSLYHLVAIIAHKGTLNGGHFWTYVKKGHEWYKMNDSVVKQVDISEVMAAQAYMVFYAMRPDSGPPNQAPTVPHNQE